ncbi:MAG: hypothetical protein GXP25_21685 [Planctomycetes bacterium]|nr:hypothetical protein [Planctomycetota bacterium]
MEERIIPFVGVMLLLALALWRKPAILVALLAVGSEYLRAVFGLIGISDRAEFIHVLLPAAFGAAIAILPIKLYTERRLHRVVLREVVAVSLCAMLFGAIVVLGMMRSPADVRLYGRSKVLKFLLACFFQFFFVLLFIIDRREIRHCMIFMLGCAFLQTVSIFLVRGSEAFHTYFYYVDPPDRIGPIVLVQGLEMGYRFSLYTVMLYLLCLYFRWPPVRLMLFGLAGFSAFLCFMTACRGAMLFAVILVLGVTVVWYRFRVVPVVLIVLLIAPLVLVFRSLAPGLHQERWSELTGEMGLGSSRAYMVGWALRDAQRHLLLGGGAGAGAHMPPVLEQRKLGWYFSDGIDRVYPHNGPVEVLHEFGIVGLVPYLLFFGLTAWKGLRTLFRLEPRSEGFLLCLWCLTMFGQDCMRLMISGDISDSFRAWIFAGMILAFVRAKTVEQEEAAEAEEPGEDSVPEMAPSGP